MLPYGENATASGVLLAAVGHCVNLPTVCVCVIIGSGEIMHQVRDLLAKSKKGPRQPNRCKNLCIVYEPLPSVYADVLGPL